MKLLLELLPKYAAHVEKHPHTLLVKFFGLYRVTPENGSKVPNPFHLYFVLGLLSEQHAAADLKLQLFPDSL